MREYLAFCLCAPMAAFGHYAGHERRGSDTVPARSGVLGLVGAAMGVARSDPNGQKALRALRVAVQPLTHSTALRDYHTVQTVPRKFKFPATRRDALEAAAAERAVNTTITLRDYRSDVAVAIAVWANEAPWPLTRIAESLRTPKYVLYAGRKSCPLSAPLAPDIVRAADPLQAVRAVPVPDWLPSPVRGSVTSDPFGGGNPDRIELGPVDPLDRNQWHFSQREIWHFARTAGA